MVQDPLRPPAEATFVKVADETSLCAPATATEVVAGRVAGFSQEVRGLNKWERRSAFVQCYTPDDSGGSELLRGHGCGHLSLRMQAER